MNNQLAFSRLVWVDVMKVMGLFFIIYGHMFSYGYEYVYAFNVPVFYVISGYLFKNGQEQSVFWRKQWWQLVVPMLIICLFDNSYLIINDFLHHRLTTSRFWFPLGMLIGDFRYLGICWFIYTLFILRVVSQLIQSNELRLLLAVVFLSIAFFVAPIIQIHEIKNAILAVLLTYPFFVIGQLVKSSSITCFSLSWKKSLLGALLSGGILFGVVQINDPVFVYSFIYGKSLLLFLLGGLSGTALLYFISRLFNHPVRWIRIIAVGSVLVLGFHRYFVILYRHFFDKSFLDLIVSAIILLLFIPVIQFSLAYVPWLIGNRREG